MQARYEERAARILKDTRGKTLVNEKKISLLKRISNLRKDNQQEKVNSPLLESLQAIAATTDSIRNTLIRQQDFEIFHNETFFTT